MAEKKRGIARITDYLVRDRARAVRDEITRPWRRGEQTPEAEVGRWLGLGLALGAILVGAGLALFTTLREE
jgi:hypothetical protein